MHEELSVSWDEDGKRGSWLSPSGLLFQTATNFLSKLSRNVGGSLDPSRLSKTLVPKWRMAPTNRATSTNSASPASRCRRIERSGDGERRIVWFRETRKQS